MPAFAQTNDDLSALVDAARKSGARVVIVDPAGTQTAEAAKPLTSAAALLAARNEFLRIVGAMREAPAEMSATLETAVTNRDNLKIIMKNGVIYKNTL